MKQAFSASDYAMIMQQITLLYESIEPFMSHRMTNEEFIQVFVRPDLRSAYRQVRDTSVNAYNYRTRTLVDSDEILDFESYANYSEPTDGVKAAVSCPIDLRVHDDENHEAAMQFRQWLQYEGQSVKDFGRLRAVVTALNNTCTSPKAVRYYWPPIEALCQGNAALAPLVGRMEQGKAPTKGGSFTFAFGQAMRKAAATVTSAKLLLSSGAANPTLRDVIIKPSRNRAYDEDGFTFLGVVQ